MCIRRHRQKLDTVSVQARVILRRDYGGELRLARQKASLFDPDLNEDEESDEP